MGEATQAALVEMLLRMGDSCLILSQRLGEWCGHAPILEEDIATANVALDLLGQARLWLSYAGEVEGRGRDEDQLAFHRDGHGFRNLLLVEQPNGDFGHTVVRQFLFDAWHGLMLRALSASRDPQVAGIAAKAAKEASYHLRRSRGWLVRLGDGTEESRRRMQAACDALWSFTGEMFLMDDAERGLAALSLGCEVEALRQPWLEEVSSALAEATLTMPTAAWMQRGGKQGLHSEHLGHLLAEMQFLQRSYPGAQW